MAINWKWPEPPELQGMPASRRRRLWNEALTRSTTPRRLLAALAVRFCVALVFGGVSQWLWPSVSPLLVGTVAMIVVGTFYDVSVSTPASRRWLREHAHELDRYVPESVVIAREHHVEPDNT